MKDKTISIGKIECQMFKFSPSEGLPILARMQNMLGGSIAELATVDIKDREGAMRVIALVVDKISDRNPPEKVNEFVKDVLTSGSLILNGSKVSHLDDFGQFEDEDAYYLMMQAMKEMLLFSFAGFLGKLGGGLAGLIPEGPKVS